MNNGKNMLIFVDGADDAYMNSADNFRGCSMSSDDSVDVYFKAAAIGSDGDTVTGYDKVTLACSNEKHVEAMKAIAACVAGSPKKNSVTVADDVNSIYVDDNITSITSITRSVTGNWLNASIITSAPTLTAASSGSTFFVNPAATTTITLPTITTAMIGWNITVIASEGDVDSTATGMNGIINIHAGAANDDFIGIILDSNDGAGDYAVSGDDYINITDSAGPGSRIDIYCDGLRYYAYGQTNEQAQCLFAASAAA
jgi:hypothetical protein